MIVPKKKYGQHFLTNEAIAQRIVNTLSFDKNQYTSVLEIGPGKGILTRYLLDREQINLFINEIDADLLTFLLTKYPDLKYSVFSGDFLELNLEQLMNSPFAIIGNFPYNISSQILFKVLKSRKRIPELTGMFQKEVARRIVSRAGTKEYGILSVLVQAYYKAEYLFEVKPGSFNPPPRVTSAVIRLTRLEQSIDCDENLFKTVVKAAFNQRRKQLVNALRHLTEKITIPEQFRSKRAEQLSVEDFVVLTNALSGQTSQSNPTGGR